MANVRVAVRVRPLSKREIANGGRIIIEIDDKVARIKNLKVDSRPDGPGGSREKVVAFGFDYCYWSVNPEDPQYASQDVVFQDLGTEVLSGAAKGYNICLFAYGQTGSGKTYTMIGTPAALGLTPRICEGLFSKEDGYSNSPSSCRIRVSFLEIYNEKVRDLLKQPDQKKPYTLRVREHPETGPYVQGLSQHVVTNSRQIIGLLEEGVANRITAATHVHEASSRSHAIFTIYYTQAVLENNLSSEIASKINLVDLAGSERADPSYCKDRITEGASINKSLVTLGIVISTLAQNSQMFISYQSPNSTSSEGGDGGSLSSPSVAGSIGGVPRKQSYIPYRDSVLTWLLKDSLGGNSKTIMVATVSPANSCYSETMSTLRYASSAKNIINKPRVNEDANVKLIRELREEIERLKGMLLSFELGNLSPFTNGRNGNLKELVLHNEMKRDQLPKDWTQKWDAWKALMEQCNVDINKKKAGVTIDPSLPHLMVLDDDVLSTGVVLYHLREGTTKIGRIDSDQEQDIVLQGQWIERDHCTITSTCGVVTLQPALGARCIVNGQEVTDSCRLTQGAIIILGQTQKFRFIHPAEAAALRQRRLLGEVSAGNSNCSLGWLDLDGDVAASRLGIPSMLEEDRRVRDIVLETRHQKQLDQAVSHRTRIRLQKHLVEDLKQDILVGQIRAEQELKFDQALINQQIKDNQRWLFREESLLASLQQQKQEDNVLAETDSEILHGFESQTGSETSSASLYGGRKRLAQLQVLWRNALWAAERKVRRKKVKFQLERIVKKQKLLEAQRKLEQLENLCWKDKLSQPMELDPSLDAAFSAFQKKSRSSSSSSLGNQRLCGLSLSPSQSVLKCEIPARLSTETVHYTPEKPASSVPRGSTILSNDSCSPNLCWVCEGRRASFGEDTSAQRTSPTISLKIASTTDRKSQETGKNKQLMRLHQNLVSVSRSAEQLKLREKPNSLIPSPQIGREKPSRNHGPPRRRWRREGDLLTNWTSRRNGSSSPHSQGTKRSVVRGKVQMTRLRQAAWALEQWEPSVASLARTSAWPRCHVFGMKDRDKRFLQNRGKTECDEGTWNSTVLRASTSSLGENENDCSDTDSTYSLDSLCCAYTRTLIRPQKQEVPEPKPCCTEPENSESDDSQMSQDSLVEKKNRAQRRLLPCSPLAQAPERSETRPVTSPKAFLPTPDSNRSWKKVRTFSLDSLNNAEEAFKEDSKEEPCSHSSDEMPVEAFWQIKNSPSTTACQEKVLEFQASDQGPGATGPNVAPQPSGSFYLALQPKTEGDKCKPLPQTQHPRNISLASVDSWFSCDSGSNTNDSQEVTMYSQKMLDIQEPEVQHMEQPKPVVEAERLQQPALEIGTGLYSFSHLQDSALVPSSATKLSIEPSLDASSEATWRPQGPCKPGSDASVSQESFHKEGRDLPSLAGYCSPVPSERALTSSRSAAPASLLSHKGSTLGKGRPVVEYLCQFSHSSLGATVTSTQVSSSSQKDTNYLPSTSGKRWDSFFPVCPEMPGDFNFNDPSFSSPSPRYLRTEQEQDGGNLELDDLSTFFRTIEKDACHSCSSTDLEAGDSELENAWVFAAENKVSASMTELHQAHQGSSKQPQSLVCRRAGSAGSFDESFFLRDISNSSSPMNAKEDQGPPTWEENLPSKLVPLKLSQPVMKTELLQSANEEIDRERSFALALSTDSEPSPPWDPFPPPEHFHPLETFYVLESRDALTETALEIPACRERGGDMPPTSRVEGLNNTFQFFRNLDRDLLLLLHTPKSKNLSSQPVVAESSFSPGVRKDPSGTGVPKSMEKYNYPVSFSSAQNRLLLESISMAAGQLGKPAEILNNKYPQSSLKIKEKAPAQPSWGVPFDDSGAMVCLPVISSVERNHEHRQRENDVRGKQTGNFLRISATDFDGQIHSGPSSNLIYQTESLNQTQHRVNVQENVLVPKKHSSASHSRCMSPMIMVQDETSSHAKEGTESVSLGMVLHPKAYSEELIPHRVDHSHGKDSVSNLLPAIAFKEEGPIASKEPESLMVIPSPQGEISRRRRNQISSQSKIVNHSEEMARLISSVAQLESSIMEIDSRQKYPPHALYMAEAYRRAMCRARKDQGKAHLTLRPNDFRDSLAYRDQPHSSKKVQEEEEVPDSFEARGIKEVNGCIQESHRGQEITSSLTSPTELMEENKMEAEHPFSPVPELSVRCPRDYLFLKFSQRCTTQNKPTNVPGSPEPLARIEPLRPEEERSEGSCDERSASELSPQSHATVRTGVFPELEPKASFQESQNIANLTITEITAKCKEPAVHGIDQETNTLRGKSPQTETHSAPLAQELPGISQITRMGRYRPQETEHPLPSQEGYPVASIQEETGSIFSSDPPKLSEKYFRSTMKAVSLSSTDSESELEFLKMQVPTPSEGRVEQPKIYGETGNHSSLGSSISCKNSFVEQSVWQSFSLQTVSGLCYQPNGAGSSPDEPSSDSYTEETMKASATAVLLEQQRGDPRITPKEMNLGNASLTEAKVTLLRNIKRASSLNQCLVEKRASHQLADSELQVPQTLEKKLWRTEDFEGKLTSSLGFWGASAPPSVNAEVNIETTVEDTGLSEECGKSSKDNTDEQIVVPKLSRASSGLWEASAISSMNPKMIVETTVGDIRLSEEYGKSSKDSTDEKIIMPELTKVLSGLWGSSSAPSMNPKMNVDITVEDTKVSEEHRKSSEGSTDKQIIMPKLSRVSSGLWGASTTPCMYPEANVETTVEDTRLSEECEKSSKDSTDEQTVMPELTKVLSGLWGSSSAPSMNPKMNVDITVEDTKVSEEHRKSSEGSTDKQIIMPKLSRVSSGLWGASTTPCMYPEANVEPTVEDTRLSEEREKSSKDSTDEHVVIPKLTRVSSRLWGASATPPMYPKTNVETIVEDTELSEEYEKSSEDNTDEHVIIPKLTRVSSGLWEASATQSIHPEADVETTGEDTELSEECEKSSKDSTDEHVVIPKLTRVSSGLWEASATPSMYPKTNVETIVEDTGLSEEHGKSSKDRTDEHITILELTRVSSELWEASATPSMYPEADVETTLEDTGLSEEYEKSSEDNTDEHVVIPKLTRVSSELWGASATPSVYSEADVETIVEDTGLSEEYEKSSKDNMDEHVVIPKLTRVSSRLWGASATPSMYPKTNVETIVEDTGLSEEYEKSSKDNMDEHVVMPKLTRVSSELWGASATPSVYSEADVETIVEDTGLSEEYEKSSKDNMDEHVVIPKLTRVSSRLWGASATPSMYPKTNVETIVEDTGLSEEYEKSSEDNMDEHVVMPKLTRVSSELWGASATPFMYPKTNVETIVEDTRLSEECEKSSKDIIGGQIIVPYSETQLDSEAFSGTPEQPHSNQRDRLELARTEDKDESQVCFTQNKATKGHIREASPGTTSGTKLYVADGLQLTKDVTVPSRGPEHASSLSLSTKINPGICISSNMQKAGEKLTRHLDPHVLSESPDRKEEVIRSPSVDSLLTSGNLLVPSALKENKRDEPPQQQLPAPPIHANSDNIRIIRHELSHAWPSKQIGIHSEVERTSLGSKESIQRAWEGFRSQSTACESLCTGDLGNSSEAVVDLQTHWETSMQCPWKDAPVHAGSEISATEMSYVMANSATLWPDLRSQESFHNRKQPVSCEAEIVEAEKPPYFANPLVASDIKQSGNLPAHPTCVHSPGSGERRASHKQDMMVSERVEGGSTGGILSQYPKLKGVTVSGQSVAYGIDSKHPRPTSFLHQSLTPAFVGEMENCPEGSMVQRNRETSKSCIKFSPSMSQEEVVTSRPLCTSQQGASSISSPPFANSLSYENSDSEKQIPRSASDTMLPVFPLSSKLNIGHQSRGLEVPLTHNLDLREDEQELKLAASNTGLPSMESPGREDSKKEVTIEPEMASLPAKTYSENLQENSKVGQNEWEFSAVTESGNYVAAGRLEAIHRSEGILENEPTVESPHLAQGPPFPKDLRDHSIPIPHPRTKAGKKPIFSNLPGSLWKKDENEQLSSNVGNEVWDRKHHHSGTDDQAGPQETGGSLTMDGKVSGPERLRFLWRRKDGSFDAQVPVPLPEVSQDSPDTGSHSDQNADARAAFSFSPENSPKDFSALKSSVGTPCRSLQELTMSVEPPSPTEDEESRGTERLFLSDLSPDESKMMMLTELKKFPRSPDCSQRILSNYSSEAPSAQPPELGIAPYPTPSTLLAMPVPEGMSSDSLVEEHNGHPKGKGWLAPENKDVMHFMSSHRHPFLQCRQQEGPGRVGWKQHVFDSARDIFCNRISWSLDTQRAVCCSSVDNDLDTLSSPFHSHLSSYANTHGVSLSSTENPSVLEEERKRCKISHVFRNHHGFSDTSITAPSTRTPDKAGDGLPEDSTLTEQEGVSGQMDNIELLYPTKSESWPKAGVATCEQGTASLAPPKLQQLPMHCQGCVDVTHPNPEATRSRPPHASWTNMQNLSMHLSQLLHNTSELLGNLSHQGKGERERSIKAEALEEAPKAVTMDNSTQTTMDVGIQTDETDPAPLDVFLHSSGHSKLAGPQEANVTTPKHGSLGGMDTPDIPQEDYPPVFQEKGPGGPAEKKQISSSPGNQRHYLIPQNSPGTSHHSLSFQKHSPAQDLLNLQTSSAISPTQSSQRNGSSCTVVTSPTLCTMSSARGSSLQGRWSTCESTSQKNKKPGFRHTLLVDRASSPILTLSASIQGPHSSSSSSKPTGPAVSHSHSTIHHQKPGATWVAPGNNSSQTCDKGKTRNIPGGSGSSTGKKLSKGSPTSYLSGTLKQSLWLQGSSASTSPGPLNHPPKLQVRASLGLLDWEEQLTGGKEKHGSWERPLYVSLPTTGLSPIEDQSEASNTSNFVAEVTLEAPNPVLVRLASQSTSWCQKKIDTGADSSEQPLKSPPQSESPSLGRVLNHCDGPLSISEVSVAPGIGGQVRDTQSEVLLRSCPEKVQASEPRHYSLRDLPVHNKFSNWCGVQGSSPAGTIPVEEAMNVDITCSEGMEKPAQPHEHLSPVPEQLQREQVQVLAGVPLELGPQTPPLSVELAEAKLLYGLGETDALLRVMQSGTGEALIPVTPTSPHQEETYFRHLKTIEVIRRERSDRLQNFRRRARSLSPMKQLSLLPTPEALVQDPDLPSRRREYLQQLRKDVVETTRSLEPVSDARGHQPSDIEVLLRDYQRAREETKMEIARARDRLRERAEQEKQRIRQQIVSQLQREEAKLQTLVSVSTLCTTSSMDSLSSCPTSGYDSNLTLASQTQPPEKQGNANLSCFKDTAGGDVRGRSVVRNHQLYLMGSAQKNLGHKRGSESHRGSCNGPQKSLINQSNSDSCPSASLCTLYHDLVKHVLASTMAEVMDACSDNLQNLFSCQAAAGWKYQGKEKDVLTYYKGFPSATRHGFLGAGVVPQPLPRVWAAVRDPTMWSLYDKSIQSAQLCQKVTSSIKLVYLVSSASVSCLKQPRDFCCVSSEAKEGQLTIMVAQSVYDKSMPRPSKNMIRGEILPSAWVLQPYTLDGKEVTKVIHMVQIHRDGSTERQAPEGGHGKTL
ncbi:stAR-related lipid transfer protein 9 isoform X2 [Notamacropus eugenii]|uniref:stAR-related lipid transfer protein 9 isoform X2 n=1 Tax=Notamacropus eugenii TaxID=9315 RepID=UPI003B66F2E4